MNAKCGTYKGWNQHKRHNTPVCDDCRKAANAYQAEWRKRPGRAAAHNLELRAEDRARRELAKRHNREYQRLRKFFKEQLSGA